MELHVAKKEKLKRTTESVLDNVIQTTLCKYPVDKERLTNLRVSSFPFCPVKWFLGLPTSTAKTREQGFHSTFFTEVGTTVHTVIQNYLKESPYVVRDWICSDAKCKHRHEFQVKPDKCEECGNPNFNHAEHKVKAGVIVGHMDDSILVARKKIRPIDYKTTGKSSVSAKGKLPHKSNVKQLEAYAAIKKSQGYDIDGWDLVYIVRDSAKPVYISCESYYGHSFEVEYPKIIKRIKKYVKDYKFVSSLDSRDQLEDLADLRHRKKAGEDKGSCGYCPYSELCLDKKAILAHLNSTFTKVKLKLPIILAKA